jgi:hypothetical protein
MIDFPRLGVVGPLMVNVYKEKGVEGRRDVFKVIL